MTDMTLKDLSQQPFEAALTMDQVHEAERLDSEFGPNRRIAFTVLTRSRQQLIDGFAADPRVAVDMVEMIGDYVARLDQEKELVGAAFARMMIVAAALNPEIQNGGDHE